MFDIVLSLEDWENTGDGSCVTAHENEVLVYHVSAFHYIYRIQEAARPRLTRKLRFRFAFALAFPYICCNQVGFI